MASVATALFLLGDAFPARAGQPLLIRIVAAPQATVSVPAGGFAAVVCVVRPGSAAPAACTNTVNLAGTVRSSTGGGGSLTITAPAGAITGVHGSPLAVSALRMTCTDHGSSGLHGPVTLASAAPSTASGVVCANWRGPGAFTYDINLTYAIDVSAAQADSYRLSGEWTVTAAAT